jgi:heat shock transcription factor, other eukaryote
MPDDAIATLLLTLEQPCRNGTGPMSFAYRLFQLVNEAISGGPTYIEWSDDGSMFKITDISKFEQRVIPGWFSHKNYSSFVRQLNIYGISP